MIELLIYRIFIMSILILCVVVVNLGVSLSERK